MSTAPWRSSGSAVSTSNRMPSQAFVPVTVRKTFDSPSVQKQPVESPEKRDRVIWPPGVRTYVQRAFNPDEAIPGVKKEEIEARLKAFISETHRSGQLDDLNWDILPLPQQMIINERNLAASSFPPLPPPGSHSYQDSSSKHDKKRKSPDSHYASQERSVPPWRANKIRQIEDQGPATPLIDRISQPLGAFDASSKSEAKKEKRMRRFDSERPNWSAHTRTATPPPDTGPVVGRSQVLEKKYFRLTSAPNPDHVRPLEVLEKTFAMLKERWRRDNNYSYICDQFKSLRQDLTVQHIRNDFTVTVYETHARIALEKADLGEYNQCQTVLRSLYARKLKGHPMEFKAYRILYLIHTCNRADMNDLLADLTKSEKMDVAVRHALDVRTATTLGNYHRLFELYNTAPHMGIYLMDMFIERERLAALAMLSKAYKNNIPISFIANELGLEDAQLVQFIIDHGGTEFVKESLKGELEFLTTPQSVFHFQSAKETAFRKVDIKGQI